MKSKSIYHLFLLVISTVSILFINVSVMYGQTTITCRDTTVHKTKSVTSVVVTQVPYDSTYKLCDTIIVVPPIPTQIQAHYDNNILAWYKSESGQDAMIRWHISNGDNRIYLYGVDGFIGSSTNDKWVTRFNDSCSAHGIQTAFVWSNPTSVTKDLERFTKLQTRQSAKFDLLISELEPYNTNSYPTFWAYSRQVKVWADKNGVESWVYVGWHNQQSTDSMVVLYKGVNMHCYIQSVNMSSGSWQYGYLKSRLGMFAQSTVTMKVANPFQTTVLYSDETAFAYTWFQANMLNQKLALSIFKQGYDLLAPSSVKSKINLMGTCLFTSSYSLRIKPAPSLPASALRMIEQPHKRKVLKTDVETGKSTIEEIDYVIYNQTKSLQ